MSTRKRTKLTKLQRVFLEPSNPTHRHYEALRAFFIEGLPSAEVAATFGYTPGSFRVLCHEFRQEPNRKFFLPTVRGPQAAPKADRVRKRIVELRKQNLSVYDIRRTLEEGGEKISVAHVAKIVKQEGFSRLPRRGDDERENVARPDPAAIADVRKLDLSPRQFKTRFGGLFLFLPFLAKVPLEKLLRKAGFPGTTQLPAACAMRSLLALKLFGSARHGHDMSQVFDEGKAFFAGLNVMPKRAFLTEYSCRITPESYPKFMQLWFQAMTEVGLERGTSFDLDFHTIPFHGEDALVEKHYISKRSRSQKGILAFLAQDADSRVFCYANGQLRKNQQDDEILKFVDFWKKRTGKLPAELVFDSKLTTYANLNKLNVMNIQFITLRRRSKQMLEKIEEEPVSAWRQIQLDGVGRIFKTPKIIDRQIRLPGYDKPLRQIIIKDLGHEEPTILITNQLKISATKPIGRYAHRMLIENGISDGIEFFHMDALSSAVAMKVNCDLQLTLMASALYRLLGAKVGNGYLTAKSRHIFLDLIDASAQVVITNDEIIVKFQKRAHNPLLLAAGFGSLDIPIPWLGNKRLRFDFGHSPE